MNKPFREWLQFALLYLALAGIAVRMEHRLTQIEDRIEALSDRVSRIEVRSVSLNSTIE